jgi:hypothetical protein
LRFVAGRSATFKISPHHAQPWNPSDETLETYSTLRRDRRRDLHPNCFYTGGAEMTIANT